jgi:simple sugar transport system permease protein
LAGGLYALVPAILKVKRGINEVITTIMMNYIAYWLAHYFIHWPPLRDPNAANPQTYPILPSAALPKLVFGTRLHAGFLIAIVSIFLVYILLEKTKTGYEIKITGSNPTAATYGGIKVGRVILISMLIGGGLAGLAGMGEVAGLHGYLLDDISPGYGYIAALIALFGRLNIIGVVLSAFFVSVLFNGADIMQLSLFIPRELADVIVSLMVLLIISRELFMKKGLKVR